MSLSIAYVLFCLVGGIQQLNFTGVVVDDDLFGPTHCGDCFYSRTTGQRLYKGVKR